VNGCEGLGYEAAESRPAAGILDSPFAPWTGPKAPPCPLQDDDVSSPVMPCLLSRPAGRPVGARRVEAALRRLRTQSRAIGKRVGRARGFRMVSFRAPVG
jgi:hypothetical protein